MASGYHDVSAGAAAGYGHTVVLRDDGTALAFGRDGDGQCSVPDLAPGLCYVAAAAGYCHTVLLRDNGTAVAFGRNGDGQCRVPELAPGRRYVAAAAGALHTVLLRDDGTAVAFGHGSQCNVPELAPGRRYVVAAAGNSHTVLLRDDGTAVAFGHDTYRQCRVPELAPGRRYVAAAAGYGHTVLLRDDGAALAFGRDGDGQCNVSAPGSAHAERDEVVARAIDAEELTRAYRYGRARSRADTQLDAASMIARRYPAGRVAGRRQGPYARQPLGTIARPWVIIRPGQGDSQCCTVCLEDFEEGAELAMLQCTHRFHLRCIGRWFARKRDCPVCRTVVS